MEHARFNRSALLREWAPDDVPERPGLDYVTATKIVWSSMQAQGERSDKPGDVPMMNDGRSGRIVTGLGPNQAIRLMWPELTVAEFQRAANAVRVILRKTCNAICMEPGRRQSLGVWWVADDWIAPEGEGYPRKEKPSMFGKTNPKRKDKGRKEKPVDAVKEETPQPLIEQFKIGGFTVEEGPAPEFATEIALPETYPQLLAYVAAGIRHYHQVSGADKLQAENDDLRARLAKIQEAMGL